MSGKISTVEYQYLPPKTFSSRTDFRIEVLKEIEGLHRHRYTFAIKEGIDFSEVPCPIIVYILFKDFSSAKCLIWPKSKKEQQVMILGIKKQLKDFTIGGEKKEVDLVAWTAETVMAVVDMKQNPEFRENMSEQEMMNKYRELSNAGKLQTRENVILSFEENGTLLKVTTVYRVEAGELVESPEDSKIINKGMKHGNSEGLMTSLLNYTEAEEFDILGNQAGTQIVNFEVNDAVKFIQNVLAEIRKSDGVDK